MNKNIISYVKKLTAGLLALGMIVAGIVVTSKQAEATDTVDATTVICKEYAKIDIEKYWKADSASRKAPLESGYVFGGWFRLATEGDTNVEKLSLNGTEASYVPLTEDEMKIGVPEKAYAKFVPAKVLSVKAQNQSKVNAEYIASLNQNLAEGQAKDYFWVRVMTSLDSKNYDRIGFDIHLANKEEGLTQADGSALETTKIYDAVMEEVNGEQKVSYAKDIFGGVSDYVCVWQLSKIDTPSNASKIIYVRPYWYTMDGTKVLGLAKYVHIEDEYKNYISVPVNILNSEAIAAGAVQMQYDNETLELVKDDEGNVLYEAGRVLPEMSFYHDADSNTIQMVGNAATVDEYNTEETIYANIRFKKPEVDTAFNMQMIQFCDWNEDPVEIKNIWDVKYDVSTVSQ